MQRSRHWLGWVTLNWAMTVCCHSAPLSIDPFLTLGIPALVSNQVQFTLTGESDVSYVVESSSEGQNWEPVTTNTSPDIARLVLLEATANELTFYRAWREPLPIYSGALVARSNIALNGNSILIDSYDSGDTNYSTTNGLFDPTKRKAGGDVFCADGFASLGNAIIKGVLRTGTTTNYSVGPDGSVGDLNWTGPGIQPGWYFNNFRFASPDVPAPYETGIVPAGNATNIWELGNWDAYIYPGNFSANLTKTIYVAGNATVYVTGTFDCAGKIIIAPGASLKLYVGGAYTRLNQVLTDGHPTSFQYYGLPSNVAVSWGGNQEYVATIYAPEASVRLGGGGSDAFDFQGACVVNALTLSGHFNFHFDENLKRIGPTR